MEEKSASHQIDEIIKAYSSWKGDLLSQIRTVILQTDPNIVEEIKWKMQTRPEGLPVWSSNGIVCFAEIWKNNIKLLFSKGAHLKDTENIFNARLQSKEIRAIEFHEFDAINKVVLSTLVKEAINLNDLNSK